MFTCQYESVFSCSHEFQFSRLLQGVESRGFFVQRLNQDVEERRSGLLCPVDQVTFVIDVIYHEHEEIYSLIISPVAFVRQMTIIDVILRKCVLDLDAQSHQMAVLGQLRHVVSDVADGCVGVRDVQVVDGDARFVTLHHGQRDVRVQRRKNLVDWINLDLVAALLRVIETVFHSERKDVFGDVGFARVDVDDLLRIQICLAESGHRSVFLRHGSEISEGWRSGDCETQVFWLICTVSGSQRIRRQNPATMQ